MAQKEIGIKKYFSNYIIEKDKGIYDAMNKGITKSNGEWIIFMNSGDIFNRLVLDKNFFSKNLSKIDIIFGDTLIDHKFMSVYKKSNYFQKIYCHDALLPSIFIGEIIYFKKK